MFAGPAQDAGSDGAGRRLSLTAALGENAVWQRAVDADLAILALI
jgi:hypothetical protein